MREAESVARLSGWGKRAMRVPGPPNYPLWLHEFERTLSRYALPFVFGPRQLASGADMRNGTCSGIVIDKSAPFLVTANHVVDEALTRLAPGDWDCVAGPLELLLCDRIISRSENLDLATIRLTQEEVQILERDDRLIVRPEEWPPRPPAVGDLIVLVGFPASARVIRSWTDGVFNAVTSQALVTGIRDDGFRYRAEMKDLRQYDVATGNEEGVLTDYAGISGGPVFRVKPGPVLRHELVGLVSEGVLAYETYPSVYFARLDRVQTDGRIAGVTSRN